MHLHLVLDVLPNLNDLLAVRRKGAKEASPPKEKSLRKASPRARTKGRSELSVSREASYRRRYPSGALFSFLTEDASHRRRNFLMILPGCYEKLIFR